MASKWFVINGDVLLDEDTLTGTGWDDSGNLWGRKLGGRWCLDYYFKLCFNLTAEYWKEHCLNIRTDQQLYNLFDDIGIAYKRNGKIYLKGEIEFEI